jgi:single-stranded-DNA-specific exonuclease
VERIWETHKKDSRIVESLSQSLGITDIAASVLCVRGIENEADAKEFLHPLEARLHDPFLLDDMDRAVDRISRAIDSKEQICIFGHEDVDGITATVTLLETLSDVGASTCYYIPNRAEEGHSLSKATIDKAKTRGARLIVTVDCEVRNEDVIEYANAEGVDIVVTDHHEITKDFGPLIRVNCKKESNKSSSTFLSGVGVAYKLAQAVAERRLKISSTQWMSAKGELLILVLFGTIADRVPLIGENRIFVVRGERMLPSSKRIAVKVLEEKGFSHAKDSVIGDVVPILSSARSRDGYNEACEFLTTTDYERALQIFLELREISRHWYTEARKTYEHVRRQADASSKLIVVVDPTISPYYLGYCANRLKEEFFRPSIVMSLKGDRYIGEGRSIDSFDLVDLLTHCRDLLTDYGGHKQAAGFSIVKKQLNTFVKKARGYAEPRAEWDDLMRRIFIDMEIGPSELTEQVRQELKLFSPFGRGNREPTFLLTGVTLKEIYSDHIRVERGQAMMSIRASGSKGKWVSLSGQPIRIDCVVSVGSKGVPYLVDSRPSFTKTP